ncbi:MAG: helix-hairpin-helix domain-containing protein [Ilumatobacteraceae bacterium]
MEPWRPSAPNETMRSVRGWLREWIVWVGWRRIVAGVASAGVIGGIGVLLLRTPSAPVEDELTYATTSVPSAGSSTVNTVMIHVAGSVARPGVYSLPDGARVVDAIDSAGGPIFGADVDAINLAATISDGQRVYVPAVGEVVIPANSDPANVGPVFPIDLNTATAADLDALPGIGPSTAAAIIRQRESTGPFASVDSLLDVPGIGRSKLEAIRGLVRV